MTNHRNMEHHSLMQSVMRCSFCQKRQGMIRDLVVLRRRAMTVCICDQCLNVCHTILAKTTKEQMRATAPSTYKISSSRLDQRAQLCCSFCDTPQELVDKLISSPPGGAATYICDKCVAVCSTAIHKDMTRGGPPKSLWHWMARKVGIHPSQIHRIN